ncbi:MAG: FGGY family carbohydrate kinase [Spirochaetales bacterium]|uniref:FGGY family carbohydrate kinase n=1 Tax=Candidatus Thalassospirochaeta sargassi TaxID=3119039 RepID=A0AAJ1IH19_9SPIO|nr:FGGY family carbohydrate kinase [Spirochaetales bacterium]
MTDCFLGIDIGTGSSKGVITDISGKILAEAQVPHDMEMPAPGQYEQDADEIWWGDFVRLCRQLCDLLSRNHGLRTENIKAVGISTIAPCVLPVDSKGRPLRKGIMYGIDTRAVDEITEIEELVGKDEIFRLTGLTLSSQACVPKMRWLQKHEPEVWDRTAKILTAAGYIVYKLTGRFTVDIYNAIGYAPLFDIRKKCWDSNHSADLNINMKLLPELLWSSDVAGTVTAEAAELTGLSIGTAIITGTADAVSEAVGAGVCMNGDMMMMYGSSNFFIMRTENLTPLSSFWSSNFIDPGTSVITGGMSTVGSMFKWFSETFPGRSLPEWENLAAAAAPGAGGITILPYFAGERTPINAPDAKGVIFGLSLQSSPGDIFRALQESVGYGIKHNIEEMRRQGTGARRIIAIGGASGSRQLMQVISDITGVSQFIPDIGLGACYGDAFLAAVGTGHFNSSAEAGKWVGVADEIVPDKDLFGFYEEGYKKYRALYESTRHLF